MKKVIPIVLIVMICCMFGGTSTEEVIIPKEAIRFRVIPNSNAEEDQDIKLKVRDQVQGQLMGLLNDTSNIDQARTTISQNLLTFEKTVDNTLEENQSAEDYRVNYGLNYFPEKKYKGVTYKEGYYESLVVTLGEGKGDNWWCVLFPPLCLLEGEETDQDQVEYKSFVKELIDKFF